MRDLKRGQFVQVGNSIGVVVFLEGERNTPEEHVGIWYGELEGSIPKYRTVPIEYCIPVDQMESYH